MSSSGVQTVGESTQCVACRKDQEGLVPGDGTSQGLCPSTPASPNLKCFSSGKCMTCLSDDITSLPDVSNGCNADATKPVCDTSTDPNAPQCVACKKQGK